MFSPRSTTVLLFFRMRPDAGVQQHDPVDKKHTVRHSEKCVAVLIPKRAEGADANDPIDVLIELLPALQQNSLGIEKGIFILCDK